MPFQPVKARHEEPESAVYFVSISPQGSMRLGLAVRNAVEDLDHTHLEVEYDAVDQRLRFRSGAVGSRIRYNVVNITKDVSRPFTHYSDLGVYRTRRHVVELNDDGWWYIVSSPRRWRDLWRG